MIKTRILIMNKSEPGTVLYRTSGESQIVFMQSLIFPMIDSYYVVLIYILTFIKNKGIAMLQFMKNIQWLSELLFKQGSIQFFESCNQESIKNAMRTFIELKILTKEGRYLELNEKYQDNETQIIDMLEYINKFRSMTQAGDVGMINDPKKGLFRRSILAKFPFMAKL